MTLFKEKWNQGITTQPGEYTDIGYRFQLNKFTRNHIYPWVKSDVYKFFNQKFYNHDQIHGLKNKTEIADIYYRLDGQY